MRAGRGPAINGRARPAAAALVVLACAALLVLPARGFGWKWVANDFFAVGASGGTGAARAVAKKCHGGKLGYYKFRSIAIGAAGDTELTVEVRLDLPVLPRWKPVRDVNLRVATPPSFDPSVTAEIVSAYTDFWEGSESKWEPGEISFRHPELVVFGSQILSEGVHKEDFKPKDKC